jgi:hypothetical protein
MGITVWALKIKQAEIKIFFGLQEQKDEGVAL